MSHSLLLVFSPPLPLCGASAALRSSFVVIFCCQMSTLVAQLAAAEAEAEAEAAEVEAEDADEQVTRCLSFVRLVVAGAAARNEASPASFSF